MEEEEEGIRRARRDWVFFALRLASSPLSYNYKYFYRFFYYVGYHGNLFYVLFSLFDNYTQTTTMKWI